MSTPPPHHPARPLNSTIPGIVAPLITAALVNVEAKDDPAHWHAVFFISAAISLVGVAAYVAGCRADLDERLAAPTGAEAGAAAAINGDDSSLELLMGERE